MSIELEKNPDIISIVAQQDPKPVTVGFAAETQDLIHYAKGKLERKNLDAIIANDVSRTDIGFNSDDNQVFFITAEGAEELPRLPKSQLSRLLIERLASI